MWLVNFIRFGCIVSAMIRKLVSRIRGNKGGGGEKGECYYVLKRMTEKGGWAKVLELSNPVSPDDIYKHLEAGVYRLDKYVKGETKFDVVWGPIQVYGDVPDAEEGVSVKSRRRTVSSKGDIFSFIEELERYSEELDRLAEVGVKLAKLGGKSVIEVPEGRTVEDVLVDMLDQLRNRWEKLDGLFGKSRVRGEEAEIPIEGKIPAWMVYAPRAVERVLDNVERRLERWGMINGSEEIVEEIPEFPKME